MSPTDGNRHGSRPGQFAEVLDLVLRRHDRARSEASPENIHALRVALRRSLSISGPMLRLDDAPQWRELHRASRRLFRKLGRLRDLQVQEAWLVHFAPEGKGLGGRLQRDMRRESKQARRRATGAIRSFKRGRWRRLIEVLPPRLERLDAEPAFLLRLAMAQLGRAQAFHQDKPGADRRYHQLRVELKQFRYFLQAFLPSLYAEWAEELATVQDLLGEAHDLDVLEDRLTALKGPDKPLDERWQRHLAVAREQRFAAYSALCGGGGHSLWSRWRLGLLAELARLDRRHYDLPGRAQSEP
jgi:CHAD domain-containing protein